MSSFASADSQQREYLFKFIVVGDVGTGKTSLIQRYVRNTVNAQYKPTIGVDFCTKLTRHDGSLVRIQFWDTAVVSRSVIKNHLREELYSRLLGIPDKRLSPLTVQTNKRPIDPWMNFRGHDRFANMMRVYYRDSHGAIVVCDCSKKNSVAGAFRWKKDLDYKLVLDNGEPIPAILLANKCDLRNEFSTAELTEMALQSGFRAAFKISAKTGQNVEEAMEFLVRQVIAAEREGLYVTPVYQRDHHIRRLNPSDETLNDRRSLKDTFRNVCC